MGIKGAKASGDLQLSAAFIEEKITSISGISTKKMFGGYGIFHEEKMFGMVNSKGGYLLKANDDTQPSFEAHNAEKHSKMPYFTIPNAILEGHEKLITWANLAISISK